MRETTLAPLPAGEDAMQPATLDANRLVLLDVDAVHHATRNLVTVPGNHPHASDRKTGSRSRP